jgi:RNA polymerase sigma-70 factor (ECF subfamily)
VGSGSTHPSLLARLRDPRDELAWREFEARYRDLIRRYCRRRGLQVADAEDVCQLVFLALARSMPGFRFDPERGRFRDYLGRIVQNAITRHVSRPRRDARVLDNAVLQDLVPERDAAVEPSWTDEWVRHHFRLAMRTVRIDCKPESLAVFERLMAGESVPDVAQAFDTTPAAVHKIKQRIGERLRREIQLQTRDEELPGPPGE